MARPVHLRIGVEGDGRWRVSVGDGATRAAEAHLPAERAAALIAAVNLNLGAAPRVMIPGEDSGRTQAEEAVGALLLETLRALPGPYGRLRELLGVAAGQGQLARVAIDAPDEAVRALPWELLAGSEEAPPLELAQTGGIARLVPGGAAPYAARSGPLRVWVWTPTPGDPTCDRLRRDLHARGHDLGLDLRDLVGEPPAEGTFPELLHVICHGRRDLAAVAVRLGEGQQSADAAAARLGPLLRRVEAVFLSVCAGGDATPRELDSLAGRLGAAGARVVLAPRQRVSAEALTRASASFYAALAQHASLFDATLAARRALRAWAHPHPQCRWSNLALFVTDLEALNAGSLVPAAWRPPGWPRPAPDAAALLEAARARAEAQGDGFLGIEHLLGALPESTGGGDLSAWLRRVLPARIAPLTRALSLLSPQPEHSGGELVLSPRLRAWGARLDTDFDLEALALVAASDADLAAGLFGAVPPASGEGGDPYATFDTGDPDSSPPASALVVFGGPDDGLRFQPSAGETVGRSAEADGPVWALYQGSRLWDRKLSRDHLRWVGPGHVEVRRAGVRGRAGQEEAVPAGPVELRVGDVLCLTAATRLVGAA